MVIVEELQHPLVVHVEVAVVEVLEIVEHLVLLDIAVLAMVDLVDNLILMDLIITGQLGVVLIHTATPLQKLILQLIAVMVVRAVEVVVPAMKLIRHLFV